MPVNPFAAFYAMRRGTYLKGAINKKLSAPPVFAKQPFSFHFAFPREQHVASDYLLLT